MFNKKPPQANLLNIINLYGQGKLHQALTEIDQMLEQFPNSAMLYNFLGATNASLNQFFDAIENYKHAIKIKPDYAEAFNNMGIALERQGKMEEAIESYNKALSLIPDYAEAYYNMGNTLEGQGKPKEAIESYKKALSINPDNAEACNNMGNVLEDQGKMEEAIVSYKKALSINPNDAKAFWNLSGTAENISEAKNWIQQCLSADQNHLKAKLTLSAFKYYEGDKSDFNDLMQSSLKNHSYMRSFAWAFSLPKLPESL